MANSRGISGGGTSTVSKVASSPNESCLSSDTPEKPKVFRISTTPSQCVNWKINWDSSDVEPPIRVWGYVPGGTAFILDQPPLKQNYQEWTVNALYGTQFVLLFHMGSPISSDTLVETSELLTVDGNETSPTFCLLPPRRPGPSSTLTPAGIPSPTPTTQPSESLESDKSTKIGAIVGGVIGGIFGLLLIVGLVIFVWYRRVDRSPPASDGQKVPSGSPDTQPQSPSSYNTRNVADEPVSQMQ